MGREESREVGRGSREDRGGSRSLRGRTRAPGHAHTQYAHAYACPARCTRACAHGVAGMNTRCSAHAVCAAHAHYHGASSAAADFTLALCIYIYIYMPVYIHLHIYIYMYVYTGQIIHWTVMATRIIMSPENF